MVVSLAPGAAVTDLPPAVALFGESQSRVVLTPAGEVVREVEALAGEHLIPLTRIGRVTGPGRPFRLRAGALSFEADPAELGRIHEDALPRRMEREAGLTT